MKKLILLIVFSLGISIFSFSQAHLESTKNVTSWVKDNLQGRVEAITEVRLWDGIKTTSTYTYNQYGMITEFRSDDGEITFAYEDINGVLHLTNRIIVPAQREYPYIEWEGKGYMQKDARSWFTDNQGNPGGRETSLDEEIIYTRINNGRTIKAETKRNDGIHIVPTFFVYDSSGKLTAEYSDNMEGEPTRIIRYDNQDRKTYEKETSGIVREYKYNDNNDIIYRKTTQTFGHDEDSEDIFTYRYDAQGNWVNKEWKNIDGQTIATYTRTIVYYK